jgi:hypothetical protein
MLHPLGGPGGWEISHNYPKRVSRGLNANLHLLLLLLPKRVKGVSVRAGHPLGIGGMSGGVPTCTSRRAQSCSRGKGHIHGKGWGPTRGDRASAGGGRLGRLGPGGTVLATEGRRRKRADAEWVCVPRAALPSLSRPCFAVILLQNAQALGRRY